jgi:membrane protein DedA with SNARE-associated domain
MMTDIAILAATGGGVGLPIALVLLVPMEAGVPIPIPDDVLMLLVGERVAAGAIPWWVGVLALEAVAAAGTVLLYVAARSAGAAVVHRVGGRVGVTEERFARVTAVLERRGRIALALGRTTPGLRTVTGLAAGSSGVRPGRALPALLLGATVFAQLHLVLGYSLGPVARDLFEQAKGPAMVLALAMLAGAALFWLLRRGGRGAAEAFGEAACPACLVLGAAGDALLDAAERPSTAAPLGRFSSHVS